MQVAQRRDELQRPASDELRLECRLALARGGDFLPEVAPVTELHDEADDDVVVAVRVEEEVVVADDAIVVAREQHFHLLQCRVRCAHVLAGHTLHHELLAAAAAATLRLLLHEEGGGERTRAELADSLVSAHGHHTAPRPTRRPSAPPPPPPPLLREAQKVAASHSSGRLLLQAAIFCGVVLFLLFADRNNKQTATRLRELYTIVKHVLVYWLGESARVILKREVAPLPCRLALIRSAERSRATSYIHLPATCHPG